jgi:hypothetical protein
MRILTLIILIGAFALSVFPQQEPSAELFDDFIQLPCDDFLTRMDITVGRAHDVIATASPEAFEKKKMVVAERLKGIDPSRIRCFFEKYDDSPGYEFWIVPPKTKRGH